MNKRKFYSAPELIRKIDWTELRNQKSSLLDVINKMEHDMPTDPETRKLIHNDVENLTGILHLIDALQDYAVDKLGISEMHVFDLEREEEREQEKPIEAFARNSADRIFDELCESDGFHQEDDIPSEFIEKIMADKYHATIIKAIVKAQILEDFEKTPLAFKFDVTAPTGIPIYDSDMREDYEGMVTAYIRHQWKKTQSRQLWLCPICASDNVETKYWVNPNDNAIGTDCEDERAYCNDCEQHVELLLTDVPANREKVVGFQVVGVDGSDHEGEIHPDMDASFCLYNLSQANEMLKYDKGKNDAGWKLLAIWTDDVEEPTFMFKGDPRK